MTETSHQGVHPGWQARSPLLYSAPGKDPAVRGPEALASHFWEEAQTSIRTGQIRVIKVSSGLSTRSLGPAVIRSPKSYGIHSIRHPCQHISLSSLGPAHSSSFWPAHSIELLTGMSHHKGHQIYSIIQIHQHHTISGAKHLYIHVTTQMQPEAERLSSRKEHRGWELSFFRFRLHYRRSFSFTLWPPIHEFFSGFIDVAVA